MVKSYIVTPIKGAVVALMFTMVLSATVKAEEKVYELSSEQAVEMAMKNNHFLKSLDHQLKQSEYGVKSAVTNFLPQASFSGSYAKIGNDLDYYARVGQGQGLGALEDVFYPDQNSSIEIQIQQPIFTGFATLNGLRSARLSHTIQGVSNEKNKQNIQYAIQQVYWGIVNLQKSKGVANEAIRQLHELTSNQEAMMEQGMSTEHDYLLTKASLAQAQLNEMKVVKNIASMKRQFAVLLGLPATSEIVLTDTNAVNEIPKNGNIDSILNVTLTNRPDLKESKLSVNKADLGLKLSKSSLYPTIAAAFTWGNSAVDYSDKDDWKYNWTLGLTLNFKLFDWGDRAFKVKQAKYQKLALDELYIQKKSSVEKEVIDAFHEVEQTSKELQTAKLLADAREKAYNAFVAKHEEGVIPMYELLDAHNQFVSAKYGVLQASTSLRLAIINLEMGGLGSSASN